MNMTTPRNISSVKNKVWIISEGTGSNFDLNTVARKEISGPVTEYKISEIAKYLISPVPIEMEESVIGCKVHYKVPPAGIIKRFFNKLAFWKKKLSDDEDAFTEDILLTPKLDHPSFKDDFLNQHLIRINEQLLSFKPIQKNVSALDRSKVREITAIGEGIDGNRYQIQLKGSVDDKINFILNSLTKKAKMTIKKAYFQDGLFDFRGYPFESFNTNNAYPLIKCFQNNQTKYCVLTPDYRVDYWVDDISLINCLHLFEQSIQTDPELKKALNLCVKGEAKPLKLFFTAKYEQNYSEKNLPMVYRNMMYSQHIDPSEIEGITETLNTNQSIVYFTYVPIAESGQHKLFTNISVMHDAKALDPIKDRVPRVYSEIIKKTTNSDVGKFYLLDSMRGFQDV